MEEAQHGRLDGPPQRGGGLHHVRVAEVPSVQQEASVGHQQNVLEV